ncbi:hypothetical protein Aduo_017701 [Ancylostoma duodenale]
MVFSKSGQKDQEDKVQAPNGDVSRSTVAGLTLGKEFKRLYCESRYAPILERRIVKKYKHFLKLLHTSLHPRDQLHLMKVTNEICFTKDKIMDLEELLASITQGRSRENAFMKNKIADLEELVASFTEAAVAKTFSRD